jgi:hypothetical protein
MKFLFGTRFNLFEMISYGIIMFFVSNTNNYWYLLLLLPVLVISVVMEDKLRVREFYKGLGIK